MARCTIANRTAEVVLEVERSELEALLAQFTGEEIETGFVAREGTAVGDVERHTVAALLDRLNDARLE